MTSTSSPPRCGVEIEFAGLDAHQAAKIIADTLGGFVERTGRHTALVHESAIGEVKLALDTRYAEPAENPGLIDNLLDALDLRDEAAGLLKDVLPVPVELITRPLLMDEFEALDHAISALRKAGATGTQGGALHAFGLHLNPELRGGAERAIRIAAAYAFAERSMRHHEPPDMTRRISPFVDPYGEDFILALARAFHRAPPELDAFIALYAQHNPDRNRGLDMWPLLGFLAPEAAEKAHGKPVKNPRPAFHYRLPDSLLGMEGWSPRADLADWMMIEQAADDRASFERMRAAAEALATARISKKDYLREIQMALE